MKPCITISMETVLSLLAIWSMKRSRAKTTERAQTKKLLEFPNVQLFCGVLYVTNVALATLTSRSETRILSISGIVVLSNY